MIDWYNLMTYLGIWGSFGIVHSLFASNTMKRIFPLKGRPYRIIYNMFAGITFLLVLYYLPSITSPIRNISNLSTIQTILFLFVSGLGLIIAISAILNWDLLGFIGFTKEEDSLNIKGIYALCRHPLYTGVILIFLSILIIDVTTDTISWLIGGGGYFFVGSYFEEIKLNSSFAKYTQYQKNVGRFFPWKRRHIEFLRNNIKN